MRNISFSEMVDQGEAGHTFYIEHSGDPDIRAKIYKHVKERYPATMFFVNDYGIITDSHNRFSLYQQLIRDLLAAGAPIDGIGIQSLSGLEYNEGQAGLALGGVPAPHLGHGV